MNWHDHVAALSNVARLATVAATKGAHYGPLLLLGARGDWRTKMQSDPNYRSYGTLQFLLGKARDKFETEPKLAREITAAVLDFVDQVEGPSHIHEIGLQGLAWKEHANACEKTGDLRAALTAAERSVEIYGEAPSLLFQQTRAELVICKVLRQTGDNDRAIEIARRCAGIFTDFDDRSSTNMARMFEAGVLYTSKRFREALVIFADVCERAERNGDRLTVAQCLQCAAQCARELGDLDGARVLYPRVVAHFDALNIPSDANCARWGQALVLAAAGRVSNAISELYKVRAVFLSLGMKGHAASATLDVVRIKFEAGEDVREICAELVPVFTQSGLTQSAIEVLAYIRQQDKNGQVMNARVKRGT